MSDRDALARFLVGFTGKDYATCREAADVIAEAYFREPPTLVCRRCNEPIIDDFVLLSSNCTSTEHLNPCPAMKESS